MLTEMRVRRLVEAGEGEKRKVSDDLTAWIYIDEKEQYAHVYVGSMSRGAIVFYDKLDVGSELGVTVVDDWLMERRAMHEADIVVKSGDNTAYVKQMGDKLRVTLLSDRGNLIDEVEVAKADLFDWLQSTKQW